MDTKEKEILKLVNDAVSFRKDQRDKEYINNMAHYEGIHWNLASYKMESPFIIKSDINHLKNAVDIRLGSLFSNYYYGRLKPQSPNDIEGIEELNVLYRNEWNRLRMDDEIEKAIKGAAICDNSYTEFNYDVDNDRITVNHIDASRVYLDPSAESIDECEYIVVRSQKSKRWLEINHPEWLDTLESKEESIDGRNIFDAENGQIYQGRNYSKKGNNLFQLDTVYCKEVQKEEVEIVTKNGEKLRDEDVRSKISIYYLLNDTLVDENNKYPFSEYPIIPMQWETQPQSPYGIPLLRGLTVPQKVVNLIESASNNIAMHYTVPSWLVSTESGIDLDDFAKLHNALGMVWEVNGDPTKATHQMPTPQINKDLIAVRNEFVANIKEYAGSMGAYIGNIGTAGSTAQGTIEAINRATIIDNSPIKQIEIYVEKLSRLLVKFMTRYYKNKKVYIRRTEEGQDEKVKFDEATVKPEYAKMDYDFTIELATRSKADKNRQYNLMKELYQMQNQYKDPNKVINVTDVVKAAQLDNYNEMFKRYSDMSEEAFAEKADLIIQILTMGQTTTPNGEPLISAEELQQGIIDVLDDNQDLSVVEGIQKKYEQYQTQISELQNQMYARELSDIQNQLAMNSQV